MNPSEKDHQRSCSFALECFMCCGRQSGGPWKATTHVLDLLGGELRCAASVFNNIHDFVLQSVIIYTSRSPLFGGSPSMW